MATDYKFRITAKDQTKGAFNSVNKSVNSTQVAMKKLAGAFASAFAIQKIVQFGQESIQLADNLGKTADKLGLTTDFLQRMQFAAEQTGIATNTLNMGMQRFIRRVAEARNGTGEAKAALEQLGIALNDSEGNARSIEDVLKDVSDGLLATEDSGEKVRLAFKFFDSEGVALVQTLGQGSQALDTLMQSATGVIPEETIRDAERFNDTMNRLQRQVLTPLRNQLIEVATAFLDVAEAMNLIDPEPTTKSIEEQRQQFENSQALILSYMHTLDELKKRNQLTEDDRIRLNKLINEEIALRDEAGAAIRAYMKAQEIFTGSVETDNPVEKINNDLKDNIIIVKDFADTIDGQLTNAFKDFFNFASDEFNDFKNLATNIARAVINELIQVFVVQKLVGMTKGIISIPENFINAADAIQDFDGGGYTGMGIRAGGIDGKGGFPAILHPNETVIDHTKGQGMSATVNFNISTVDAAGFDQLLTARKGTITTIINEAMNTQGKMGVV